MKIEWRGDDEAEVIFHGIKGVFYLIGDGSAEFEIKENPEGTKERKICGLIKKICGLAKKMKVRRLYFLAESGSFEDEIFGKTRGTRYSHSEFMYAAGASSERKDNGVAPKVRNGVEEEEDTFIVTDEENSLFSAKLRPYSEGLYIYDVKVSEASRNQGVGTKYMESIMYAFKDYDLYLQVGSQNRIACHLYEKVGFSVETEIKYYLAD